VILDLLFTAPVGCEFCTGKSEKGDDRPPEKVAHTNLNLRCDCQRRSPVFRRMRFLERKKVCFAQAKGMWTSTNTWIQAD